jgi:hypothetical protein
VNSDENKPASNRRISLTYYPRKTNRLSKVFKRHGIQMMNNSNTIQIRNLLESAKMKKAKNINPEVTKLHEQREDVLFSIHIAQLIKINRDKICETSACL